MSGVAVIDVNRTGRVIDWCGHRSPLDDSPEGRFLQDIWPEEPAVGTDLARVLQGEERTCAWCLAGVESTVSCLPKGNGALIVVRFAASPTTLERRQLAFVEALNHELRTPLTIISGFAQLLNAVGEDATAVQRRAWLESVLTAAARLRGHIDNLLSIVQEESPSLQTGTVEIATVVRRAMATIGADQPDFVIRWSGDVEMRLGADADATHTILCRLLENAVDAGRSACISWGAERGVVAIRVRDEGMGIGSIGRAVLFTPFGTEPDQPGAGGRIGLGLSLYLARRTARTLHGDLSLERSGSDGACFLLTLPLAQAAAVPAKSTDLKVPDTVDCDQEPHHATGIVGR